MNRASRNAADFPRRGDVIHVRLDPVQGSEQGGERPALVLSPDVINEYAPIVLVAPLTSKKTDKTYPFEVVIEAGEAGLRLTSKALLLQMRAIDKTRITSYLGALTPETLQRVEVALRVATGLTPT